MPETKLKNSQLPDTLQNKTIDTSNDIDTTPTRLSISGGSAGQVLSTDGSGNLSWTTAGGGVSDGDKGDITVSGSGSTWTIDNGAVNYAKIQSGTSNAVIGYPTTGAPQRVGLHSSLAYISNTLGTTVASNANNRKDFFLTTTGLVNQIDYVTIFSIQPGLGTWLVMANLVGYANNVNFVMHGQLSGNLSGISEASQTVMASGTAGRFTSATVTLFGYLTTTTLSTIEIRCAKSNAPGFNSNWTLIPGTQDADATGLRLSSIGTKISILRVA
jgi:hypothetical protein